MPSLASAICEHMTVEMVLLHSGSSDSQYNIVALFSYEHMIVPIQSTTSLQLRDSVVGHKLIVHAIYSQVQVNSLAF